MTFLLDLIHTIQDSLSDFHDRAIAQSHNEVLHRVDEHLAQLPGRCEAKAMGEFEGSPEEQGEDG